MKISVPPSSPLRDADFIYGVATSSFQIEGAAQEREMSIWDTFCEKQDAIKDRSDGRIACEHCKYWESDIDLIASLGVDAYRLSISWPRVIKRDGSQNPTGIAFYRRLLDRLRAKGIKAFVTLYHWDLPQHLEDQGGWLNRDTAFKFRDYVKIIVEAFGNRVYSYATLNEPYCSAYLGYEAGIHAPGLADKRYGRKAAHHLLLAHGLAMQVLEKHSPHTVNGIVLNFTPCHAVTNRVEDRQAATIADDYHNQWYIKPLIDGCYPDLLHELPEEQKPDIRAGDMAVISHSLDFLGVNFYTRVVCRACENGWYEELPPGDVVKTAMGWEVYPEALTQLLVSLNNTYALPPIYITENGMAAEDVLQAGEIHDRDRLAYYTMHLNALHEAIKNGVDVRGYFAWSLMDNFEWAEGFAKRFGLVYVDYATQRRIPKLSALCYRDFISSRKSGDANPLSNGKLSVK